MTVEIIIATNLTQIGFTFTFDTKQPYIFDKLDNLKTVTIAKSAIQHNMAKDLPKMHVQTCIIWGRNDQVTPPEVAEDFHKLMPNSTLYWIDKCGHAAMMEHPDEFNRLLHEWLNKVGL